MATADVVILVIVILSIALGLWRGLVKEVLSLVVWLLAFWVSLTFGRDLGDLIGRLLGSPTVGAALGFTLLFIAVVMAGAFATKLAGKALAGSGLGHVDRLLGGLFGLLRGMAIVVIGLTVASFFPIQDAGWYKASRFAPQLAPYVAWVRGHLAAPPGLRT